MTAGPDERRADARDPLQQLGRRHLAHRRVDQRRLARVLARRARARRAASPTKSRVRRDRPSASRTRRSVAAQLLSNASRFRVAHPSHAIPDRSPSSAAVSWRQPSPSVPSSVSAPTRARVETDGRQRPAVRRRHAFDGDTGCREVDEEHREAAPPGRVGIGAGDRRAPFGLVRAGHEHLLAVEHPPAEHGPAAVGPRRCGDVREVGAGAGLGVRDAHVDGSRDGRRDEAVALGLGAEREHRRRDERRRRVDQRRVVVRGLEAQDRLPAAGPAAAAVLRRQAHAEQPRVAGPARAPSARTPRPSRSGRSWSR